MTRRRNRNIQPKLKNKQIITDTYHFSPVGGNWFKFITLISNDDNLSTGKTGYVETVGNISLDCTFTQDTGSTGVISNTAAFIMFIPESYQVTAQTPVKHPEWIMAYKYLGSPTSAADQGMQPIRIRTRVRRTLMTGDSIVLFIQGKTTGSESSPDFDYLLKFASRIN